MLLDTQQRPLRNLRVSVTDRCNLRCSYCMPEPDYVWLPREDILHFEEIERLVGVFTSLGVDKVRLTGGEPLLRRDVGDLVQRLAARSAIRDLAMTTNGVLLAPQAQALRDAGLHRLTVSLDTLRPDRFRSLTRFDENLQPVPALAESWETTDNTVYTFKLRQGVTRLGTGGGSEIVFDDGYASAEHCRIVMTPLGFRLIDGGATNGSHVNERRVLEHDLVDNDTILLGKTRFRFKTTMT